MLLLGKQHRSWCFEITTYFLLRHMYKYKKKKKTFTMFAAVISKSCCRWSDEGRKGEQYISP